MGTLLFGVTFGWDTPSTVAFCNVSVGLNQFFVTEQHFMQDVQRQNTLECIMGN